MCILLKVYNLSPNPNYHYALIPLFYQKPQHKTCKSQSFKRKHIFSMIKWETSYIHQTNEVLGSKNKNLGYW